ncbi:MAG: tetratricopeptide repeat protein [Thermosynechococcaceae cyanobacterium]
MVISHRFYWGIGTAAVISSLVCFIPALAIPASDSAQASAVTLGADPLQAAASEDRSLMLHTAGIRKALEGDYQDAIANYDQALNLSPQNPEIYYNRAVAHYSVGHPKLALDDFDHAIQLQPTMAEAYANRSTVRLEAGDAKGAIADGQKAAQLFEQQGEPDLAAEMQDWVNQHEAIADRF